MEHGGLFPDDLGIIHKVPPLHRMQLLEVLQERDTGILTSSRAISVRKSGAYKEKAYQQRLVAAFLFFFFWKEGHASRQQPFVV